MRNTQAHHSVSHLPIPLFDRLLWEGNQGVSHSSLQFIHVAFALTMVALVSALGVEAVSDYTNSTQGNFPPRGICEADGPVRFNSEVMSTARSAGVLQTTGYDDQQGELGQVHRSGRAKVTLQTRE
jgi:hypothetical protein